MGGWIDVDGVCCRCFPFLRKEPSWDSMTANTVCVVNKILKITRTSVFSETLDECAVWKEMNLSHF